jgi:hypothetical protein
MVSIQLLKTVRLSLLGRILSPQSPMIQIAIDELYSLLYDSQGGVTQSNQQLSSLLDSGTVAFTGDVSITSSSQLSTLLQQPAANSPIAVTSFIFRPGGVPGGNVYTTEASLVEGLKLANGAPYTILFDLALDHNGNTHIFTTVGELDFPPGGTWTDNAKYYNLWFLHETTISNPPLRWSGALQVVAEQNASVFTISQDGFLCWFDGDFVVQVEGGPFFHVTAPGFVGFEFHDQALCECYENSPFVHGEVGSTVQLFLYDSAGAYGTNAVTGAGTVLVNPYSSTTYMDPSLFPFVHFPNNPGYLIDYQGGMISTIPASQCRVGTLIFDVASAKFYYSTGTAWAQFVNGH